MQQKDVMSLILFDAVQRRAPENIFASRDIISEVVEGWGQNKYVYPNAIIKFQHQKNTKYRLM